MHKKIYTAIRAAKQPKFGLFALTLGVAILSSNASAQDDSSIVYAQDYFAQYRPVTLEDMIRNIPGGATVMNDLRRGGGNRGFGATGAPILINGRRMSGKANDMATALARIQASQVKHIELIRGNAEGLDIRSEGILFNVILTEEAESSSTSFAEAAINMVRETNVRPELLLSHTGRRDALEYALSYQLDTGPRVIHTDEDILNADLSPREFRHLVAESDNTEHKLTGSFSYSFDNGNRVRLNTLYASSGHDRQRLEDRFLVGDGGARTFYALDDALFDFNKDKWEVGGDFEGDLGRLGALKTLFVVTRTDNEDTIRQELTEDDVTDRYFTSFAAYDEGETILRASLNTPLFEGQSLEWGAEGAFNTLDRTYAFDDDPLQTAIVKEDRYEVFGIHSFTITDNMELQSGLTAEFSSISQTQDNVSNERSFDYLKPRFEFRFDASASDQWRLLAERTVSQLNLNDFVASRNESDETINFGNPNLVPEKTWKYSISYEHRFANDAGAIKLALSYEDISDKIDKILIDTASSGVGNIGDANRIQAEVEASVRFGFIGVPNALLTASYRYTDSEVTDPFTGQERILRWTTPHWWNLDFRHDIPEWKLAWGAGAHRRYRMERHDVNVQETATFKRHVEAWIEYNIADDIKIRFQSHRFLGDKKFNYRTYYVGHIADGVIDRIEDQAHNTNTMWMVKLQASF